MAKDKKAIIVYSDWIDLFVALTDEEAGKLIKHFFKYVNDENPIATDRIIELSFIQIKNALKRDLNKWEQTVETRSHNGRMGNLKRYHIDLFNSVEAKTMTLEQAEIIAKSRKTSPPDSIAINDVAKLAVNDSVNVSDSVNDSVSVSDTITKVIEIPEFLEFSTYAKEKEPKVNIKALKNKYDAWVVNGWKNGNDRPIKNWKSALLQTLIYIEKNKTNGMVY
jgi:hypothetical protein